MEVRRQRRRRFEHMMAVARRNLGRRLAATGRVQVLIVGVMVVEDVLHARTGADQLLVGVRQLFEVVLEVADLRQSRRRT